MSRKIHYIDFNPGFVKFVRTEIVFCGIKNKYWSRSTTSIEGVTCKLCLKKLTIKNNQQPK